MVIASADKTNLEFTLFEQVLEQIPTPVMAVNNELEVIFLNAAGRELVGLSWEELKGRPCSSVMNTLHCGKPDCCMCKAMADGRMYSARNEATIRGQKVPIEYFAAPLRDPDGNVVGGLEYIIDITERVRHEQRLQEQARTIREISTPALKLWEGIIVLPVVGVVDSMRAQQMMETMLARIVDNSCKVAILDIQGVPTVDTAVANHFIKIVKAIRLMGCHAIISGISPMVAQTVVGLGIDMGVRTNSNLSDALCDAFMLINCEVRSYKTRRRGA